MSSPETAEQYAARFASYVEGRDPLSMQREAPKTIAALINGVCADELKQRPDPDRWSVVEIIAHMAEDELSSSWRYRQMIEHNGAPLLGFDQDLWAKLGDYQSWEPQDALAMYRLLREANLRLLEKLTPKQWECSGVHAERGPMTVRQLARHMAAHDINHIQQIKRRLK
ncbi:MAG TPA: DinB family protein [Candidatus Acidoferrales bacterium]|nr:DinB family protein [Candidatus Acidoferrales bacterium]